MPITDSRNKNGVLTLDDNPFEVQATSVALTPSTDEEGDAVETLARDTLTADDVTTWTLDITAIQDFADPEGFVEFCRATAGQIVDYSWKPTSATVPVYSGTVKIRPAVIGGAVNERLTSEVSFPCQEEPTVDNTP